MEFLIEILFVVVVLGVMGFGSYWVWSRRQKLRLREDEKPIHDGKWWNGPWDGRRGSSRNNQDDTDFDSFDSFDD